MRETLSFGQIPEFVRNFIKNISAFEDKATVVGLYGDLGSGKTTFTKEVAKQLGVEEIVTSPTFTLQSIYKTNSDKFEKLVHIDVYRIEDIDEVNILRLNELFQKPKTLILIEWMDKIEDELKNDFVKIKIEHVNDMRREIEIEW